MMEEILLPASDRTILYVHVWRAAEPKAAILLAHGMAEHSLRYDAFGRFLADQGISLYCHDQRGHGKTGAAHLGHLRQNVDWNLMINDLFTIKKKLIEEECTCPVFLMGHSMGSFLVRRTIQLRSDMFDGLILSGTGDNNGLAGKAAVRMAAAGCLLAGQEAHAERLQKMVFGGFNKAVEKPRTEFDWLTRDEAIVDQYLADDNCGFMCTNGFYYELMQGIQIANDLQKMQSIRKSLPVYLFSGDKDPVGGCGDGVQRVYKLFLDAGLEDVTIRLYPGGRHEMLNELNRDMVMKELLQWVMWQLEKMQKNQAAAVDGSQM